MGLQTGVHRAADWVADWVAGWVAGWVAHLDFLVERLVFDLELFEIDQVQPCRGDQARTCVSGWLAE